MPTGCPTRALPLLTRTATPHVLSLSYLVPYLIEDLNALCDFLQGPVNLLLQLPVRTHPVLARCSVSRVFGCICTLYLFITARKRLFACTVFRISLQI